MGCAPAYACVRVPLETDHPKRYTQYVDMGVPPPPHSCHLPCLNKGDISFQACPEDGDAVHSGDTTREDVDRRGCRSHWGGQCYTLPSSTVYSTSSSKRLQAPR